jgi:hypothetical protein
MRTVQRVPDTEEAKARSRLLAHFIDHPQQVFYSRQIEILFEAEFFHWVTNRAARSLSFWNPLDRGIFMRSREFAVHTLPSFVAAESLPKS